MEFGPEVHHGARWRRHPSTGNPRRRCSWAHEAAKAALALHPEPPPSESEGLDRSITVAKAVARLAAKVLPSWPKLDLGPNAERVPVLEETSVKKVCKPNSWGWVGTFWQCSECLRGKRDSLLARPADGACTLALRVQPAALRALGHRCAVMDCSDGSFLCVC